MHFGVILPLQLQVHLGQVTIQRRLCLKSTSFYQPSPDVTLSPPSSQCDKRCTGTATVSLRAHYPGHGLPHQGVHFMKLYKRNSLWLSIKKSCSSLRDGSGTLGGTTWVGSSEQICSPSDASHHHPTLRLLPSACLGPDSICLESIFINQLKCFVEQGGYMEMFFSFKTKHFCKPSHTISRVFSQGKKISNWAWLS